LTGAPGFTFLAPAAGCIAIFAAGFGAAWTSGFALVALGHGLAAVSLSELHALSASAATTPTAASTRADRP